MTLGNMVDRIADELARDDLKPQTEDAVRSAINHYAGERWWFNEVVTATLTLTSSLEFYALPTDFEHLETDALSVVQDSQLLDCELRHYGTISRWQTGQVFGVPTHFAIYDEQFDFYPTPDRSLEVIFSYVQTVSTLTSTTCTNAFMTYGEELIRSRARADIQLNFLRDEGTTTEYTLLAQTGLPFYTHRERAAYNSLRARANRRMATGAIRGSGF